MHVLYERGTHFRAREAQDVIRISIDQRFLWMHEPTRKMRESNLLFTIKSAVFEVFCAGGTDDCHSCDWTATNGCPKSRQMAAIILPDSSSTTKRRSLTARRNPFTMNGLLPDYGIHPA